MRSPARAEFHAELVEKLLVSFTCMVTGVIVLQAVNGCIIGLRRIL